MRAAGAWPAGPLGLLEEYTVALRSLLRGRTVTTDGLYVRLSSARLGSAPGVVPDVLLGVRGPRSLAVAGTPESARARLQGLAGAGVTDAVLIPVGADPLAAHDDLAAVL